MEEKIENTSALWQNIDSYKKAEYLTKHKPDCRFCFASGEAFDCHKWILACASSHFQEMFNGRFKETNDPPVSIKILDADPLDFKKLIDFIYYNETESLKYLPMSTLKNLLTLSKQYKINELTKACLDVLRRNLNAMDDNDVIRVFEYGYQEYDKELIQQASEIILKRAKYGISHGHIFDFLSPKRDDGKKDDAKRDEGLRLTHENKMIKGIRRVTKPPTSSTNTSLNNLNTAAPPNSSGFGFGAAPITTTTTTNSPGFGVSFSAAAASLNASVVKPASLFGTASQLPVTTSNTTTTTSTSPFAPKDAFGNPINGFSFGSASDSSAIFSKKPKDSATAADEGEDNKENSNDKEKSAMPIRSDFFKSDTNLSVRQSQILGCLHIHNLNECIFYEFLRLLSGTIAEIERFNLIETYAKINQLNNPNGNKVYASASDSSNADAASKTSSEGNSTHDSIEHIPDINFSIGKEHRQNNSQTLNMMLSTINFYNMSPKEFCAGPGKSNLLSVEEKYEKLSGIIKSRY